MTSPDPKPIVNLEEVEGLEQLIAQATPQRLDTAEVHTDDEIIECPFCGGEGQVDAETYTNYDDAAIGVQFFGVGDQFLKNEAAFTELWRLAPALLALVKWQEKEIERRDALLRDAKREMWMTAP